METLYMNCDTIEDQNDYDYNIREEEDDDGITCYDRDGEPHNFDGPAYKSSDGRSEYWYMHGKRHREDGPAYISRIGGQSYWLFGHKCTKEQFYDIRHDENKLLLFILSQE